MFEYFEHDFDHICSVKVEYVVKVIFQIRLIGWFGVDDI